MVNEALAKRLVRDGHEVTFVVGTYPGAKDKETHADGYEIIRMGNRYNLFFVAWRYYRKNLTGWADLVIDEVNTMPFFAKYYVDAPTIVFAHMLCRRIWFYELPFPISLGGYILEPLYLRLINVGHAITVSESTRQDLLRVGFKPDNVHVISEGITTKPLAKLPPLSGKAKQPTMLSFGAMRAMKRTLDQIKAFEIAKQSIPELKLDVAGSSAGNYGQKVLQAIAASPYENDITYHGRVSEKQKLELMRRAHVITQTSIKEGWGLTVTEANSQGTPAVVYDIDGLRDSVQTGKRGGVPTGIIVKQNNPQTLAAGIVTLLDDKKLYASYRQAAWRWSQEITFDASYIDFTQVIVLNSIIEPYQ